ncbi:MAG: YraN family protein, partial [Waterburya sp.]
MNKIGTLGEQLIGKWLQLQNYELLSQNWRCSWGEIDLIAQDKA